METKLQAKTVMIEELSLTTADLNNINYTRVCGSTEPRSSPNSKLDRGSPVDNKPSTD